MSCIDCTGCGHRPKTADAVSEDGMGMYCNQFQDMPQANVCLSHTQFDAAKKEGDARLKAKREEHKMQKALKGPTGSYLHLT